MAQNNLRKQVLGLYKQFLKLSDKWESATKKLEDTISEKDFIKNETRTLFRRNARVSDENEILEHIKEANARLSLALHYRNPYPRPVNLPPKSMVSMSSKKWKKQKEIRTISKPLYAKSIDIDDLKN